jgi:hypothetical protein
MPTAAASPSAARRSSRPAALLCRDYSRHAFSYIVPAPEPGAAGTIFMTLADENTVYLRRGEAAAGTPQEIWLRCGPSISSLESRPRT